MAIVVAITRIFTRALPLNYNLIQSSKAAAVSKLIKQNYCSHFSPLSSLRSSSLQYCKISGIATMASLSPMDPSSFSRPEEVIVKHISLKLNVDFDTKILCGEALLTLEALGDIRDVVLDVRDLHIESVESEDGTALSYKESEALVDFGSKLTINLNKPSASHDKFNVRIKYSTCPKASALQWLEPSQTAGKLHPYMFSQCQPIHARSIMPCQDTPAVKFTYDAQISAPAQFTVLMSALRVDSQNQTSMFNQPVPIPAYLLAIAVGALQSRELGPRTLVWSEKELIDKSAWEFADTEKFLQAAEKLCGPYVWTQYDLLVLPPSFPYGGMENPCLTFVTPTLLAGDRSQADVIMHEIMHSWTGNLVTNANFEHFWLNEGWTVFLERKAAASLIQDPDEARKSRDFQSLLGLQELSEAINQLGATNPLTQLVVNLTGIHPDDAFSRVPYEKGSLFLRFLEDTVGGPAVFDEFIRHYLTTFQKQSLVTCQFQQLFQEYFQGNEKVNSIDWDLWLTSPGMPPIIPEYDTSMTLVVKDLVRKLTKKKMSASEISAAAASFMPHQIIHLLQELIEKPALAINQLHELGKGLKLEQAQNSELVFRWLRLCIKSQEKSKLQAALDFVNNQGRMKYVRPIYRDLYAWKEVRQQTIDNFLANEKNMMHVSAYTVRKDLHLDSQSKVE